MMNTIQNDNLKICVQSRGAELCSVRSAGGTEYMWGGDPAVWGKHSPILFPAVGRMADNQYRYNGKTYEMPKHGFARDSEFTLVESGDNTLVFELTDNAQTLICWPFRFRFRVRYTLAGNTLTVGFEVTNPNDEEMLFSLGAHPAFACPLEEGLEYSDYLLEFETAETAGRWYLKDGLLGRCEPRFLDNQRRLGLSRELFDDDAIIFKGLSSNSLTLKSDKGGRAVKVDVEGWPDLGIWSKGSGFVCIEPWFGHDDPAGFNGTLQDKPGIVKLPAGERFAVDYRMSFL